MRGAFIQTAESLRRWRGSQKKRLGRPLAAGCGVGVLVVAGVVIWVSRPEVPASHAGERSVQVPVDGRLDVRQAGQTPAGSRRHEGIYRDFFTLEPAGRQSVGQDANQAIAPAGEPASQPHREDGRGGPHLKAILIGCQPKALIDDKIVSVGEKLKLIAGGPNDDEFEVTAIDSDGVQLKRGGQVTVLRLEPEDDGQ
jgi:hypothetical protein